MGIVFFFYQRYIPKVGAQKARRSRKRSWLASRTTLDQKLFTCATYLKINTFRKSTNLIDWEEPFPFKMQTLASIAKKRPWKGVSRSLLMPTLKMPNPQLTIQILKELMLQSRSRKGSNYAAIKTQSGFLPEHLACSFI